MFKLNHILVLILATGSITACSWETDEESAWTVEVEHPQNSEDEGGGTNDDSDTNDDSGEGSDQNAAIVYQTSFEDGTVGDWIAQGSVGMATVQDAQDGVYALEASGRAENWNAPGVVLTEQLEVGKTYQFSAWVKLSGSDAANIKMTLKTSVEGQETTYNGVTEAVAASDSDWVEVKGTYTYTAEGTVTEAFLYVEGPEAGVDYLIDNFVVEQVQAASEEETQSDLYSANFDDGTVGDWSQQGGITIEAVENAKVGSHALSATGRTAGWNAPGVELVETLVVGNTYEFSFWLKLLDKEAAQVKASIKYSFGTANDQYGEVLPLTDASNADWVQLTGQYTVDAMGESEAPTGIFVYIESSDAEASYLIDDFTINPASPETD
ncbi:carbohydrate binding domain-containing protein [Catenovulum sediminis]|uniref:endo-1,4-beta-xylanase n=1 Tax=Catenovulum sediminis TaxID=1740262 RepID=A0ABV1RBV0_9ALTE